MIAVQGWILGCKRGAILRVQWHSLGQHSFCCLKVFSTYTIGALAPWPAAQQLPLLTQGVSTLNTGEDKPKGQGLFAAELCPVTTAEGTNLELFRNAQGSSSRDVVSQGTFCQ